MAVPRQSRACSKISGLAVNIIMAYRNRMEKVLPIGHYNRERGAHFHSTMTRSTSFQYYLDFNKQASY
eukprot:scaffold481_cov208-Cylindrotheca_fusiformis.AAC.4